MRFSPHGHERLAERASDVLAGRALDARQIRAARATREALPAVLHVMCDEGRLVRWKAPGGWSAASQTYRLLGEALPGVDLSTWEMFADPVLEWAERTLTDATPGDIFAYVAAVLGAPAYVVQFEERGLIAERPRVPLTLEPDLAGEAVRLGHELVLL
jgi:hypothetical protein